MTAAPFPGTLVPPGAREAWETLLIAVFFADVAVPCSGPDRDKWTSDDQADRDRAAQACHHCPVLGPCGAYAEAAQEHRFVYAGIDRTIPQRKETNDLHLS